MKNLHLIHTSCWETGCSPLRFVAKQECSCHHTPMNIVAEVLANAIRQERNLSHKATYCIIPIMGHSVKGNTIQTVKKTTKQNKKQISCCLGLGIGEAQRILGLGTQSLGVYHSGYMTLYTRQNSWHVQHRENLWVNHELQLAIIYW